MQNAQKWSFMTSSLERQWPLKLFSCGNFYCVNIKCEKNKNKVIDSEYDGLKSKYSEIENVAY